MNTSCYIKQIKKAPGSQKLTRRGASLLRPLLYLCMLGSPLEPPGWAGLFICAQRYEPWPPGLEARGWLKTRGLAAQGQVGGPGMVCGPDMVDECHQTHCHQSSFQGRMVLWTPGNSSTRDPVTAGLSPMNVREDFTEHYGPGHGFSNAIGN